MRDAGGAVSCTDQKHDGPPMGRAVALSHCQISIYFNGIVAPNVIPNVFCGFTASLVFLP